MTSTSRYRSQHCALGNCSRCSGSFGHVERQTSCCCGCHDPARSAIAEVAARKEHEGALRLLAALDQHKADDPLAEQITDLILATSAPKSEAAELARDVISLVRAFDKRIALRQAADDERQAQANTSKEDDDGYDY